MTDEAKRASSLWQAVDERLGLRGLAYPVPAHANTLASSLGGVTLMSFLILVVTGLLMAQFYHPTPEAARSSVIHILTKVAGGPYIRSLHYWAAQAMVLSVLLHLARVFLTGAFKRPREANWLVGVGLLALTVALYFTGTVLKWDQEAVEALAHNSAIADLLGGLAAWFSPVYHQALPILLRLYIVHVSALPALLTLLIAAHFLLVKWHGMAPSPWQGTDERQVPFTSHLQRLGGYGLVLVGLLLILAMAFPPRLGPPGVEGIEVTRPPWPFLPLFALENWVGVGGLIWASLLGLVLLLLVPLVDRSAERQPGRRLGAVVAAAALAIAVVGLGLYAALAPATAHIGKG